MLLINYQSSAFVGLSYVHLGIVLNVGAVVLHSLPTTGSVEGWLAQRSPRFSASEIEVIFKILSF
jgi:hypothetical protein